MVPTLSRGGVRTTLKASVLGEAGIMLQAQPRESVEPAAGFTCASLVEEARLQPGGRSSEYARLVGVPV